MFVVEAESAPALIDSIQARRSVVTQGPASNMGRLDGKEPSLIALAGLAEYVNYFITMEGFPLLSERVAFTNDTGIAAGANTGALDADFDRCFGFESLAYTEQTRLLVADTDDFEAASSRTKLKNLSNTRVLL
jgi:diaminopropionate ammonia-lyase